MISPSINHKNISLLNYLNVDKAAVLGFIIILIYNWI